MTMEEANQENEGHATGEAGRRRPHLQGLPRVLIVCGISRALHSNGGVGLHVLRFAEALRRLGHPVEVWFKEDMGLSASFPQSIAPFVVQAILPFTVGARKSRFDIVHVHAGDGCLLGMLKAALGPKRPALVWTTHGLEPLTLDLYRKYAAQPDVPKIAAPYLWAYRAMGLRSALCARTFDCTVAITRTNAAWLRSECGINDERIALIPNGVDPEILDLPRPEPDRPRHALFIGTWWWRKGHWLLRDAFIELAGRYDDLRLHLWGTASEDFDVLSEFPRALRDRVHIVRSFTPEQLREAIPRFDMFILPSVYEGGTPLALLEGMAAGLPCIATRSPGIEDLVATAPPCASLAEAGSTESLVQAWEAVLATPESAWEMARRARERARSFTWDAVGGKLSDVYLRLSEMRRRR